jgi:hypothetical protein
VILWFLATVAVVVGGAVLVVRWALDFSGAMEEMKKKPTGVQGSIDPTTGARGSVDPITPSERYVDRVLTRIVGPTGIAGHHDPDTEARLRELAMTADALERKAREYSDAGTMTAAHAAVGKARALRAALQRLQMDEESIWASDGLLGKSFDDREAQLDDNVRDAIERTKRDENELIDKEPLKPKEQKS